MFLELIATFVAGFAAAGMMMLVIRVTGRRLPRWLIPVAAGMGMIAVTVSSEYNWYSRTVATLPEGIEVAQTVEAQVWYRPWTFVVPYVERFMAVDVATMRRNEEQPGMVLADVLLFGRWQPIHKFAVMFDCVGLRQAQVPEEVNFDENGALVGAVWVPIEAGHPALELTCGEK